jgi:hypothetical protein
MQGGCFFDAMHGASGGFTVLVRLFCFMLCLKEKVELIN